MGLGSRGFVLSLAIVLIIDVVLAAANLAGPAEGVLPDVEGPPRLGIPEVDTSKNCYLPGEEVTIILTNVGAGPLFYGYVPNFIVENATTIGTVREAIGGFPREVFVLGPGENMKWTWDGKWQTVDGRNKGQLVPAADYDGVVQVLAGFPDPDLVDIGRAPFSIGACVAQISAGDDFFVDEGTEFSFRPIIHITGNATVTSVTWDLDPAVDANGDGNATNDIDLVGQNPTHVLGDDGTYRIVMNLRGFGTIESKVRLDQDVVFVIDASGSMVTQDPSGMRRFAAKAYVDRLVPDDRAAVVMFNDIATLIGQHHLTMDYAQVKEDIDQVGGFGGTFLSAGIRRGLTELRDYGDAKHIWLEIFMSDGDSTAFRDRFELPRTLDLARDLGVKIYTVGIRAGENPEAEAVLKQIANETGGKYFPAPTPENLVAILEDVAEEVNQTTGQFFVVSDEVVVTVRNVDPIVGASADVEQAPPANLTLRVAGEKFHDVRLGLLRDGAEVGSATVVRMPGSPDAQAGTIVGALLPGNVNVAHVVYTPLDDPINGQVQGADPAWLNITFPDGTFFSYEHTFNVEHPDTWVWDVDLTEASAGGVATATIDVDIADPGSDDILIGIDWGDGSTSTMTVYQDGLGPDPFPSPGGAPVELALVFAHPYTRAGTYTVTIVVGDDDGGFATLTLTVTIA